MRKSWDEVESYEDLSANQKEFADWLATPKSHRDISTQEKLAEKLGLGRSTLSKWKYKDPMIKIVEKRRRKLVGVTGIQDVIDGLVGRAKKINEKERDSGANKAAELLMNFYYNRDFTKGTEVNQNVSQSQEDSSSKQMKAVIGALHEIDDDQREILIEKVSKALSGGEED